MKRITNQFIKGRAKGFTNAQMGLIRASAAKETQRQIDAMKQKDTEMAFLCMLAIPLNVLVSDYWEKASKKKLQDFLLKVCDLYKAYESGYVTNDELAKFLWDKAEFEVYSDWLNFRKETE